MKAILEEYGQIILAMVIVLLMIGFAPSISQAVKDKWNGSIDQLIAKDNGGGSTQQPQQPPAPPKPEPQPQPTSIYTFVEDEEYTPYLIQMASWKNFNTGDSVDLQVYSSYVKGHIINCSDQITWYIDPQELEFCDKVIVCNDFRYLQNPRTGGIFLLDDESILQGALQFNINEMAYDPFNNIYVAATDDGLKYSLDPMSRDFTNTNATGSFYNIIYNENLKCFVASDEYALWYSKDGQNWKQQTESYMSQIIDLTYSYNTGKFVACTSDEILISADGLNWTNPLSMPKPFSSNSNPDYIFSILTYDLNYNRFIIANENELWYSEDDGVSWKVEPIVNDTTNSSNCQFIDGIMFECTHKGIPIAYNGNGYWYDLMANE